MTTSNNKVTKEIGERKLGQLGINEMRIWLTTNFFSMAKFQLEKYNFDLWKMVQNFQITKNKNPNC